MKNNYIQNNLPDFVDIAAKVCKGVLIPFDQGYLKFDKIKLDYKLFTPIYAFKGQKYPYFYFIFISENYILKQVYTRHCYDFLYAFPYKLFTP